jgi:hypothetical protein
MRDKSCRIVYDKQPVFEEDLEILGPERHLGDFFFSARVRMVSLLVTALVVRMVPIRTMIVTACIVGMTPVRTMLVAMVGGDLHFPTLLGSGWENPNRVMRSETKRPRKSDGKYPRPSL